MPFEIEFSTDAERHLKQFNARERKVILDTIEQQLSQQPNVPTRNRKLLRANPLAAWELRVQDFRVFYNIDEEQVLVIVVAIGEKDGNRLLIDGEEFQL